MKKIFTLLTMFMVSLMAIAQTNPNRLIVQHKSGTTGYLAERIDSIYFAKVEGRVAADVTFNAFRKGTDGDTVFVAVKKTPECKAYKIACITGALAKKLNDDAAVERYFQMVNERMMQDDFTNAAMTGFNFQFKDNTDYCLITIGYDKYGVACSSSKAEFRTPAVPVVGNPTVATQVIEVKQTEFTIKFTPNKDCAGYAICSFEKGTAQQQFEQWGPMMGFANIGDMIKRFSGKEYTEELTNTWRSMTPGKEYEVYVQPWDVNGTYADMVIVPLTTLKYGGTGLAEITITIGEFGNSNGQHYQKVTYTPNDQTSFHRDIIITEEGYNKLGETGVIEMLKKDNPQDPYWNQYGVDEATWNADPSTKYLACSIGQNINGEWGTFIKVPFTTPASAGAKHNKPIPARINSANHGVTFGPVNKMMPESNIRNIKLTSAE